MKYIALPDKAVRRLSFYLAMEEYIAHNRPGEDCFFMWQVNPTVIFGRNQLMENEINFDYVRSHGIEYYRRKSGGGCVYADFSNIMFSYITDDFNVSFTFDRYLQLIAHTLNKLGVKAVASGRNDITVDGKKYRETLSIAHRAEVSSTVLCSSIPTSKIWFYPLPPTTRNSLLRESNPSEKE